VQDIKRKFNVILDLGAGPGHLTKLIERQTAAKVVMLDSSGELGAGCTEGSAEQG
jgi:NADH dehydrogenase [ubiquinone] 1 alpha subcomplex assembly factor 5